MIKRTIIIVAQLGLALSLAACGQDPAAQPTALPTTAPTAVPTTPPATVTPAPRIPEGAVSFTNAKGQPLAGHLYGRGEVAVVLAHGMPGSEEEWREFATQLAAQDFSALTFTFRAAADPQNYYGSETFGEDVQAAMHFLRANGYTRIVCMGSSRGAAACHDASAEEPMAGLVNLSGASSLVMAKSKAYPKLFIGTEFDSYTSIVKIMYDGAVEPKTIQVLPGGEHGTEMFGTPNKAELERLLLDFLHGVRG